ncbi:MAG: hypothetical protein ACSLFP_17720 [Acidimicrobiales bacterium]
MDPAAARAVLGLGDEPTWAEVRVAYRAQIAVAHPDRSGGSTQRAARVNDAYAALEQAHRQGHLHARPPAPPAPSASPAPWPTGPAAAPEPMAEPPEVLEGDTVHLALPPDEAFVRLVEACHHIGDVTYLDRSCAILEALVRVEGEGVCSLLITLQGRADGTDAFCTLEAIERVASPPVRHVVEALVAALRHPQADDRAG